MRFQDYKLGAWLLFFLFLPGAFAVETPTQTLLERLKVNAHEQLTRLRVFAIADDAELEALRRIIEEVEHAIDPPSTVEGFWKKRLEILTNPIPFFDFRRSFQNAFRLVGLSRDFESPWAKEMMLTSATMFTLTHGGEFVSGAILGTYSLLNGNIETALGWYGLAVPGLYDVGCLAGQCFLVLKHGRTSFNITRKIVFEYAGKTASKLGIPLALKTIFDQVSVKEKLKTALESQAKVTVFDLEIADKDLTTFHIKDGNGNALVTLKFTDGDNGELVLEYASFEPDFHKSNFRDLNELMENFGWNVKGAIRQIYKLLSRNRADLIPLEHTFISGAAPLPNGGIEVGFRKGAVTLTPKWTIKESVREKAASCFSLFSRFTLD